MLTPVTPARERPSRTSGAEAWRSCWSTGSVLSIRRILCQLVAEDAAFPRLVSLACHDLRTPLATVAGFAHTLARLDELDPPADRYVEMMIAASGEMTELLDGLGLLARIEAGRYEPTPSRADSLDAGTRRPPLGWEWTRSRCTGTGGAVAVDPEAAEQRRLRARALCAAARRPRARDDVGQRLLS